MTTQKRASKLTAYPVQNKIIKLQAHLAVTHAIIRKLVRIQLKTLRQLRMASVRLHDPKVVVRAILEIETDFKEVQKLAPRGSDAIKTTIKSIVTQKHVKGCTAVASVERGEWDTPWYFTGRNEYFKGKNYVEMKCNSTKCNAHLLVRESDIYAAIADSLKLK